jgi:hypothetical protein
MGVTSSKTKPHNALYSVIPFSAAGILFGNQTHVLAGYQPHKKNPCITGIGGSRNEGEPALQTAWRETIEELFDCKTIPPKLLKLCETNFVPHHWFNRGDYICFQYSFEDLKRFLKLVKQFCLQTPLYESYPTTLLDLLMNRKRSRSSEIESLCLLPIVRETTGLLHIHEEFCLDMDQSF